MATIAEVKTWLGRMQASGFYGGSSARVRSTALEQLSSVLSDDEPDDASYMLEIIDELATRWETKNDGNPATAKTYRSRASSTLRQFLDHQDDPASLHPRARKRRPVLKKRSDVTQRPRDLRPPGIRRDIYKAKDHQEFVLTLSGGRQARLVVPSRLSAVDIEILRKQLELLELQVERLEEENQSS